jgi:hypothetical protein
MLYLLWGLLNLTIIVYFIIVCFKVIKVIKEKLGIITLFIFIFSLFSLMHFSQKANDKNEIFDLKKNDSITSYIKFSSAKKVNIILEKTLVSTFMLDINFGRNRFQTIPFNATSTLNGFVGGLKWVPKTISIKQKKTKNEYIYNVYGIVEWQLLDNTIYSEEKIYIGNINLNE